MKKILIVLALLIFVGGCSSELEDDILNNKSLEMVPPPNNEGEE
jgi:hypothetical protein